MSFKLYVLPSYERCAKKLGPRERHMAGLIVEGLHNYFQMESFITGKAIVVNLEERNYRLVFKKLQGAVWEAYLTGKIRVLTRLEKNIHFLVFAGNHDQVRQFLKEN